MLAGGETTIASPGIRPVPLENFLAFAQQDGNLRVRTTLYLGYNNTCGVPLRPDWYAEYPPVFETDAMVRIPGIKIYADGGGCNDPAWSIDIPPEFSGDNPRGDLYFTAAELAPVVRGLQETGYQVAIHALGDRGVEIVQNALEAALDGQPNTYRHRMEHNPFIRPELLSRYGELGIVPVVFGGLKAGGRCKVADGTGLLFQLGLVRQLLTFVFSEQRDGSCSSSRRESDTARGVPSPAVHR